MDLQERIDRLFHEGKSIEEIAKELGLKIEQNPSPMFYLDSSGKRIAGIPGRMIAMIHGDEGEMEFAFKSPRRPGRPMQTRYLDVPWKNEIEDISSLPLGLLPLCYNSKERKAELYASPFREEGTVVVVCFFCKIEPAKVTLAGIQGRLVKFLEEKDGSIITVFHFDLEEVLKGEPWLRLVVDGEEWNPAN